MKNVNEKKMLLENVFTLIIYISICIEYYIIQKVLSHSLKEDVYF